MQKDFLADAPVITYLYPEEQPHFFLYNDTKGITRNGTTAGGGNNASYRSLCIVTDKRILFFTNGSRGSALQIGAVTDAVANTGHMKHSLQITTATDEYTFYVNNSIDGEEVNQCANYILGQARQFANTDPNPEPTPIEELHPVWQKELEATPSPDEALATSPQGAYVTRDRYEKIKDILDPDEQVHILTRGSTVDVEGLQYVLVGVADGVTAGDPVTESIELILWCHTGTEPEASLYRWLSRGRREPSTGSS